jgi:hypothetical protein
MPLDESEAACEALLHATSATPGGVAILTGSNAAAIALEAWDTVALTPGERPTLRVTAGTSLLVLIVFAT